LFDKFSFWYVPLILKEAAKNFRETLVLNHALHTMRLNFLLESHLDKLSLWPVPLFLKKKKNFLNSHKTLMQGRLPRTTLLGSGSEKINLTA
jgi:hypothetical protein